ncbi:hypothetical protein N7468_001768 [Penicillium chermesinum]|uniref:Thioesterase domain-containing protein n=1 Tax=Penicillium chermesinum TaxID=63820 RepID=A0A9W9PH74_9EURO|nr:uncharacterized protein N7468_001768 [Penicillium chermesinum]KAJ5246785.1 hypothetical protein N7468_001768 [Penicillium chermesinum]
MFRRQFLSLPSIAASVPPAPRIAPSPFRSLLRGAKASRQPFIYPRYTRRYNSSTTAPRPKTRFRRFIGFVTIAALSFGAGLGYKALEITLRVMASPVPTDEETLSLYEPQDETAQSRPHLKFPEIIRARSLTAGTLAGPNKIVVPPYVFSEKSGKSLVSFMYLGSDVCGHPGIVHGGMLATLLDEGLARCCFPALPNKVGVTANLNLDYRAPAMADQYVALRAETVKVEGRKAWVEGRIETVPQDGSKPVVLVEAKALFVEPKQAATMSKLARGLNE